MALYNITKLTQELLGAGLPIAGVSLLNSGTSVEISWQTTPTVQQLATAETVKAAHDPTDYNALERAAGRDSIRADAAATLAAFQTALDTWATLTAAQQKAVLKRCVQVEVALIKLLRHL
jgi:hypothetical protein